MQQKIVSRLVVILTSLVMLGVSFIIVSKVFKDTILYFYTPSEISQLQPNKKIRLGGFVKVGSVKQEAGQIYTFTLTDFENEVVVSYTGLLPNLFREGQGTIAIGAFNVTGAFQAESIMAKHDENYMPKEVADKLKAKGLWKESQPQ